MKKEDLKKKLSERSPLSNTRPVIKPVNLYDVPKKDDQFQENKTDEKSHNRTFAQSHQNTIVRINRGYKFREDIIKEMKNLATNSNKKLYKVMEEAMLDYLKKTPLVSKYPLFTEFSLWACRIFALVRFRTNALMRYRINAQSHSKITIFKA